MANGSDCDAFMGCKVNIDKFIGFCLGRGPNWLTDGFLCGKGGKALHPLNGDCWCSVATWRSKHCGSWRGTPSASSFHCEPGMAISGDLLYCRGYLTSLKTKCQLFG